jgi:hypothetical protein
MRASSPVVAEERGCENWPFFCFKEERGTRGAMQAVCSSKVREHCCNSERDSPMLIAESMLELIAREGGLIRYPALEEWAILL